MNILYLHGLNSSLSTEKRKILERFGNVQAPSIDYENIPDSIDWLYNLYKDSKIELITGSSMGGFAGYYLSNIYQCPSLLFNPALAERSLYQSIPEMEHKKNPFKQIVLGTQDDVINPKQTLDFLAETLINHPEYKVHIHNQLAHPIPIDIFEEEVKLFFNRCVTNFF